MTGITYEGRWWPPEEVCTPSGRKGREVEAGYLEETGQEKHKANLITLNLQVAADEVDFF